MSKTPAADPFAAGILHHRAGRLAEAEACYRQAIAASPGHADAHANLGVALKGLGRLDDAVAAYGEALRIKPDHAAALANLGNALMALGRPTEAADAYREATLVTPGNAEAHCNLGNALLGADRLDDAIAAYRQAVRFKPGHANAHYNLGNVLKARASLDEAAASYRQAIAVRPDFAEAHSNLGNVLHEQRKHEEALDAYGRAIALRPDLPEVHYNRGNALRETGRLGDAVAAYRAAIRARPDYAEAHGNLGIALMSQGRTAEAVDAYRQAIRIKADYPEAHSNLLFCLNYLDGETPQAISAAHREWGERYGGAPPPAAHANDRNPDRKLRIGYVSPDLREHSVAYFVLPLLQAHDPQAVDVFCYADVAQSDFMTGQLRTLAGHWRDTAAMPDAALADLVRADGIDILVDLAGHTAHNRLLALARKPAPVQATWLGYSNTTGLRAVDYRIVDAVTDPPGEADNLASETLLRLPGGFLCYGGMKGAPAPAVPPCLQSGAVTFGSFNNPSKLSPATLDAWANLLKRLPQARLLLKGKSLADPATRDLLLTRLRERGVADERVELVAWVASSAAHIALYERIDVALDPFPYNGTTTTCEALWMGVPVVTLRGDRHAGRVGASMLTRIGADDWIADTAEAYVDIAAALAGDPQGLADTRSSLRARMQASPLCDRDAFARDMEAAYRDMWRRWCAA